jgi:hypothetical protein
MQNKPTRVILLLAILFSTTFQTCKQKKATPAVDATIKIVKINAVGITSLPVECPKGKQIVGGGYTITASNPALIVRGSYPLSRTTWQVDVLNTSGKEIDGATLIVAAYYYTGNENPGMQIQKSESVIQAPPPAGAAKYFFSRNVTKRFPSEVVTSGGFKISSPYSADDIAVLGSYPTIGSGVGSDNYVTGWTNNVAVSAGRTCSITNYVLYSDGQVQKPKNIPVFEQGPVMQKLISGLNPSDELSVDKDYFCTGGGYNLRVGTSDPTYFPVVSWENNANTKPGMLFGWQFYGNGVTVAGGFPSWDMYALQLKLH